MVHATYEDILQRVRERSVPYVSVVEWQYWQQAPPQGVMSWPLTLRIDMALRMR
jgi:hypothetical protein